MSRPVLKGLYAIVDLAATPDPVRAAEDFVRGGAAVLQLRDKRRAESEDNRRRFLSVARAIGAFKKDHPFLWIVNDDLAVAREIGADGIHVGKDDPPISECRKILGPDKIIGYSSHSLEEAVAAERAGADYVAFGAIFPTTTKGPGHPVQGLDKLRSVVASLKAPVVAIGGIGRNNIKDVLATGAASVAMISALAHAKDRIAETQFFSRFFSSGGE